jgi:zeaxanthin glucosyltransferase
MTHFGAICPAASGHSNPTAALAKELIDRGHRCTFFQVADWEEKIRRQGSDFYAIGLEEYPSGSWLSVLERLGRISGFDSVKFTIETYQRELQIICRDVPPAAEKLGIEAFLVDQSEPAGTTVAEHLGVPSITLCMAMLLNQDEDIPPPITPWQYQPTWWARLRNRICYFALNRLSAPILDALNEQRIRWGLPLVDSFNDTCSPFAQISQQPQAFEFPRSRLPQTFHFCGPLRQPQKSLVLEKNLALALESTLPLVYGSLGTIQNRKKELFWTMAEACSGLAVQLVIAHGGALTEAEAHSLPGRTLAVPWAPQPEVLRGAAVCITHCGMNTVLDALSQGVPCVAIPQAHEQPAIAQRLEWSSAGINLGIGKLSSARLSSGIATVLSELNFRTAAHRLQEDIVSAGGVRKAADICEQVASSRQPVTFCQIGAI